MMSNGCRRLYEYVIGKNPALRRDAAAAPFIRKSPLLYIEVGLMIPAARRHALTNPEQSCLTLPVLAIEQDEYCP